MDDKILLEIAYLREMNEQLLKMIKQMKQEQKQQPKKNWCKDFSYY